MSKIIEWIGDNLLLSGLITSLAAIVIAAASKGIWRYLRGKERKSPQQDTHDVDVGGVDIREQKAGRDFVNIEDIQAERDVNIAFNRPDNGSGKELDEAEPILHIFPNKDMAEFRRTVPGSSSNEDDGIFIRLWVAITNDGSRYATINRYGVSIPSLGYKEETLQPLQPGRDRIRTREGECRSTNTGFSSLTDGEGQINIGPDREPEKGFLCFKIPLIIQSRDVTELDCDLTIWDYYDNRASCRIKLIKQGY